jgi:hypothetical protein
MMAMDESFISLVLEIFKKCAGRSGCEVCREHMEEDCLSCRTQLKPVFFRQVFHPLELLGTT